jgi:hypothetical protein
MIGSAMRKMRTLSQKPCSTIGKDAAKSSGLKKACCTAAQPLDCEMT